MGNRLVITVKVNDEKRFSMYWHWDASCSSEFYYKCRLLSALDPSDDLETMLGKVCEDFPNAGLITHDSWWKDDWRSENVQKEYATEIEVVKQMLSKGIPEGEDRNEGLIAITPKAMENMEYVAEWASELDLDDPDFCFEDCLWLSEDPEDYADDEVLEMPEMMKTIVTKENAAELAESSTKIMDGFYRDPKTNTVYQLC